MSDDFYLSVAVCVLGGLLLALLLNMGSCYDHEMARKDYVRCLDKAKPADCAPLLDAK